MPSTTELLKIPPGPAWYHPDDSRSRFRPSRWLTRCADFITTLYFGIMKPDPKILRWMGSGRISSSFNGHLSPVWYSVLGRYGYFDIMSWNLPYAEFPSSGHHRWGEIAGNPDGFRFPRTRFVGFRRGSIVQEIKPYTIMCLPDGRWKLEKARTGKQLCSPQHIRW